MSTTKVNARKWLGAATAAALVLGSATLTMAASRNNLRTGASRAPVVSFQWQTYAPAHTVHMDPTNGANGSVGDLHTDALHMPAVGFTWQTFAPRRVVHTDHPNGSASQSGGTQTDALNTTTGIFHWQTFAPPHIVNGQPSNGTGSTVPGGVHTDTLCSTPFRPTLVYGLGTDDAGGIRAAMGVSFRIR